METGRDLFLDPSLARADYVRRLEAHVESVRASCEGLGVSHVLLDTSKPLELALFDFLKARSVRGKLIRRKGAAA